MQYESWLSEKYYVDKGQNCRYRQILSGDISSKEAVHKKNAATPVAARQNRELSSALEKSGTRGRWRPRLGAH